MPAGWIESKVIRAPLFGPITGQETRRPERQRQRRPRTAPLRLRNCAGPGRSAHPVPASAPRPCPRDVTAGVPIRIPDVTNGLLLSKGIVFLLTMMPALSSAVAASFPVNPDRQTGPRASGGCPCRRRPAGNPLACRRSARALALRTICARVRLEGRLHGLLEANGLGGDHVHQRPALDAGKDLPVDRLRQTPRGRGSCRCAAREGSCGSWS